MLLLLPLNTNLDADQISLQLTSLRESPQWVAVRQNATFKWTVRIRLPISSSPVLG